MDEVKQEVAAASPQLKKRGRPKGSKNAPKKKGAQKTIVKQKHNCCCCGKSFDRQVNNFNTSRSTLYESNGGYITVCKNCVAELYDKLYEFFDRNAYAAMERLCQIFDWYYNEDAVAAALVDCEGRRNPATYYPSRVSMTQYISKGKTYLDTIVGRSMADISHIVAPSVDLQQSRPTFKGSSSADVSDEMISKWGNRYSADEVDILERHYADLHASGQKIDVVQEGLIEDLCRIRILQDRALIANNVDEYDKASKLYQNTLKIANLAPNIRDSRNEEDECWGTFIRTIEKHTPAEYYKDKKLFSDFDKIGEYFSRFVLRPMKNLILGTNEKDPQYNIDDEAGDP